MTSLNIHIPLKYVKQSSKLQEIDEDMWQGYVDRANEYEISIADIINASEELFGENLALGVCEMIMQRCFDNKSIHEISEWILKNIKN